MREERWLSWGVVACMGERGFVGERMGVERGYDSC